MEQSKMTAQFAAVMELPLSSAPAETPPHISTDGAMGSMMNTVEASVISNSGQLLALRDILWGNHPRCLQKRSLTRRPRDPNQILGIK
jgi:hypothetical protein